jgi:hypothetical protein
MPRALQRGTFSFIALSAQRDLFIPLPLFMSA